MNARVLALATIGLLGVAVAPASAATVTKSGAVVTYAEAPGGEANSPSVDLTLDQTELVISGGNPGAGCTGSQFVPNTAYCPIAGITEIRFLLGAMDDSVVITGGVPASVRTYVETGGFVELVQSVTNHAPGPLEVVGGPGPDSVTSFGDAVDTVTAGTGDDQVRTDGGDDVVDLGPGLDEAHTGRGADMVDGGDDADLIYGGADGDLMFGGNGADDLWGELGSDILDGEAGDDRVQGDASFEMGAFEDDALHGGPGTDTADFGPRGGLLPVTVTLDGQANDGADGEGDNVGPNGDIERVEGSGNDDTLIGSDNGDQLYGDAGNDTLDGRGGADWLDGFAGADQLAGGAGNDLVEGSGDGDALLGEDGDDELLGGTGDDTIGGGAGADILHGGLDHDTLLARDGFADSIQCSMGTDTAEVDGIDTFVDRLFCENVLGEQPAAPGGPVEPGADAPLARPGLAVPTGQRLGGVRRKGLKLRATAPAAGRIEATLLLPRRAAKRVRLAASTPVVIGRRSLGVPTPGAVTLRVKLTKKAKSRLRRARSIKPTLRLTFTDAAGARTSTSRKLTLRR